MAKRNVCRTTGIFFTGVKMWLITYTKFNHFGAQITGFGLKTDKLSSELEKLKICVWVIMVFVVPGQ